MLDDADKAAGVRLRTHMRGQLEDISREISDLLHRLEEIERKQKDLRREARMIRDSLSLVRDRMRTVVWFAHTEAGMSMQDIGDVLGVSRQRVHQMISEVNERRERAAQRHADKVSVVVAAPGQEVLLPG